jgi:hypothetical protein
MTDDEVRRAVLDFLTKKQKRFMINDIMKALQKDDPDLKKKQLKSVTTAMISDGSLAYWSSGSTTYFSLPGLQPKEED